MERKNFLYYDYIIANFLSLKIEFREGKYFLYYDANGIQKERELSGPDVDALVRFVSNTDSMLHELGHPKDPDARSKFMRRVASEYGKDFDAARAFLEKAAGINKSTIIKSIGYLNEAAEDLEKRTGEAKQHLLKASKYYGGGEPVPIYENTGELIIAIPDSVVDLQTQEKITNAAGDLMEAMGFELEAQEEPIHGSFFSRSKWKRIKQIFTEEATEVYEKAKVALEVQQINMPQAEVTHKLATAAASLLEATKDVKQIVVRCEGLLLVKAVINGETVVVIETVSPKLAAALNAIPTMIQDPATMFHVLSAEKAKNKLIEESGTEV
jgi:hypothetical protein